jgi:integrase
MKRSDHRLSDTFVQRLKPTDRLVRYWDLEIPGFGAACTPSGAKHFLVYFSRGKAKVFQTIGSFPAWSVAKAREKARELRRMFEDGRDIRAIVKEERKAQPLSELVTVWREECAPNLKPSTLASYNSLIQTHILPHLGKRLVKDLTYQDVKAVYALVRKRTPISANRVAAILSKLFNLAEKEGWRPSGTNPLLQLERNPEKPRTRILSSSDLALLEACLGRLVAGGSLNKLAADLTKFLALSGLRRGEALGLRWTDIDSDLKTMTFASHKTDQYGTKVLPLNSHLSKILVERAKGALGQFVFPGKNPAKPYQGFNKNWVQIQSECGIGDFTPHDLRRTFNSVCAELGYPHSVFESLLGHRLPGVQSIYTILNPNGILAEASQATSDWVSAAIHGKNPQHGSKVNSSPKRKEA